MDTFTTVKESDELPNIFAAFNDPLDLFAVVCISLLGVALFAWLEIGTARHTQNQQPPQGPKGFQSWKQKSSENKSIQQLLELETRESNLPLISLQDLSKHDGKSEVSWVCVKGVIYDVSTNNVYERTGGYNLFAGKDASYALATMLFDKIDDRQWRKCTKEQLQCLDDWVQYYQDKYKKVGYLEEEYQTKKDK